MVKKLALVAICLACLGGTAMAQDAKTVIASAKKALGDPDIHHVFGIGQGCGVPAVRSQCDRR